MLTLVRKQKPVIEYEKYAWIFDDNSVKTYKITNWLTDDYFKTEYGSFLWDDSKAEVFGKKQTKDKKIIRLVCIYQTQDLRSNEHINKITERSSP